MTPEPRALPKVSDTRCQTPRGMGFCRSSEVSLESKAGSGTRRRRSGSFEGDDNVRATVEGSRFATRLDLDLEEALVPCMFRAERKFAADAVMT